MKRREKVWVLGAGCWGAGAVLGRCWGGAGAVLGRGGGGGGVRLVKVFPLSPGKSDSGSYRCFVTHISIL